MIYRSLGMQSHYIKSTISYGLVLSSISIDSSHSLLMFINHHIFRLWVIRNGLYRCDGTKRLNGSKIRHPLKSHEIGVKRIHMTRLG